MPYSSQAADRVRYAILCQVLIIYPVGRVPKQTSKQIIYPVGRVPKQPAIIIKSTFINRSLLCLARSYTRGKVLLYLAMFLPNNLRYHRSPMANLLRRQSHGKVLFYLAIFLPNNRRGHCNFSFCRYLQFCLVCFHRWSFSIFVREFANSVQFTKATFYFLL